jgi:hypothetical protein
MARAIHSNERRRSAGGCRGWRLVSDASQDTLPERASTLIRVLDVAEVDQREAVELEAITGAVTTW